MTHRGFRSLKPVSYERRDAARTTHTVLARADGLWLVWRDKVLDGVVIRLIRSP